jgi:hypothetical protein
MPKLKILYVITKGNWGGAQKYVFDMATHMPKDTTSVEVICGEGETLPEKLTSARISVQKLPYLGRNINVIKDIQVFFYIIRIFKK